MADSTKQDDIFIQYLENYKKLIYKVARIYCKQPEDIKDLVQDIILQLWKSFSKYDEKYAMSTWTYRIALNVSISFLRKATNRQKNFNRYYDNKELIQIEDEVINDKMEQLYKFIDLLKPIDKALMILYLEGCKNKVIAQVLGFSETNVSTRKQRIQDKLKLFFETNK